MADRRISRRDMLIRAGAASVAGLSAFPQSAGAASLQDVIVVGAGSAGISAARTIRSYRRKVLVLEALHRVGGRVETDNRFPTPFDLGGQFFGDVVSGNNALYQIALAMGLPVISGNSVTPGFLNGDPSQFAATYAAELAALLPQGELVRDGLQADVSIRDALSGLEDFPYFDVARNLLLVQDGADPTIGSLLDYYNFASHSPAPFIYPVNDIFYLPYGMGNLIERLAKELPILLESPVRRISYGAYPVAVELHDGRRFYGRTVIVTPSTGVLASGLIEFEPPLPKPYCDAIEALPMGTAYKAAFSFTTNIFAGRQGVQSNEMRSLVDLEGQPGLSVFVNYFNQKMCVFIADADLADRYERMPPLQAARFFLGILERYFPGAMAAWTGQFRKTNWRKNPFTRGATSFATVGNVPARTQLAQPLKSRLWFAGEALSISDHSQIQGAWLSGEAAAYGALAALGIAAPFTQ